MSPNPRRSYGGLLARWALPVLYAAGIFAFSGIPGDDLPQVGIGDKLVHALVFAGLAVLTCRALRLQNPGWSGCAVAGLAVLVTFAYGCLDELHQGFVSGRRSDLADALANGAGAVAAAWAWKRGKSGHRQRQSVTCRGPDSNRHGRMVQRILSPLCLPFHHPGGRRDASGSS